MDELSRVSAEAAHEEDVAGWNDIGSATPAVKQDSKLGQVVPGGIPEDSPSRMRPVEKAPAEEETERATKTPNLDYTRLADEIAAKQYQAQLAANQQFMQMQQQMQSSQAPDDDYEQFKQSLIKQGALPEALEDLEKLIAKREQVQQRKQFEQQSQQSQKQHIDECWGMFQDSLEDLGVPNAIRASVEQRAAHLFYTDPEFAEASQKMWRGVKPNQKLVSKVLKKANDSIAAELGLAQPQKPVSLQSSRPTPGASGKAGPLKFTSDSQRAYYEAFKELGEDRMKQSLRHVT